MSELNARIRELFNGKTVVAFYIRHTYVVPDEWMVALGKELQERGYGTVGLLAGDAIDFMNLDGLDHVFQVRPGDVETLDSIACFIVTDSEGFSIMESKGFMMPDFEKPMRYPRTSRVLAIVHSCSPGDPEAFLQGAISTSAFDALIVGFPFAHREDITALWDNFSPPRRRLRPAGDFYLMGYGYPKLCLMRQNFLARRRDGVRAQTICYAPTDIQYAPYYGGNRLKTYGKRILRTLLAAFPDHTVIFRPTPKNREEDIVREIIACFAHEPRLIIDTQTSYLDTFARTQVMITDFAHIASSFCTVTHRPAVYFQPWITENGLHREGLFYTANSFSKLTLAVKHALAHASAWAEDDIDSFIRSRGYLPFEHSLRDLADDLSDFIDRKPHPDWLVIRRDNNSPGASAAKIMETILQEYKGVQLYHAVVYADYFQSGPLAVLAIHLWHQRSPESTIPRIITELSGMTESHVTFGDVSAQELVHLYGQAATALRAEKNVSNEETAALLRRMAKLVEDNTPL